jgi:hypothetical protein
MSYTKLFSSIVTSTIWTEDADTCKVWVTMLAIANRHGEVQASIPGLAQIAGMTLESTELAISKFLAPDRYSRTSDDEGRRIEKIDGGWILLNHAKYRAMASKDEEKSANSKRQAAFRERKARNEKVTESNGLSRLSNGETPTVTANRDIAEAEAKADPFNNENILSLCVEDSHKPKPTSTPEQLRIGRILNQGRRATTLFSDVEAKAFKQCDFTEDEIRIVEAFYLATERQNEPLHRRTGLLSLLNHWPDEVGKAQAWAKKYGYRPTAPKNNEPLPEGYK